MHTSGLHRVEGFSSITTLFGENVGCYKDNNGSFNHYSLTRFVSHLGCSKIGYMMVELAGLLWNNYENLYRHVFTSVSFLDDILNY